MAYLRNELEAWGLDHLFPPSTHMAGHAGGETTNRIVTSAERVYSTDSEGRRSLDGFAGLHCVNVGYGRREIADPISDQVHRLPYFHSYDGHGNNVLGFGPALCPNHADVDTIVETVRGALDAVAAEL